LKKKEVKKTEPSSQLFDKALGRMKPKETPPVKKETIPLKVEESILVPEEKTFEV
jgi:hypothetical protein